MPAHSSGRNVTLTAVIRTYKTADGPLRVLFAMATQAEYGAALRRSIDPLITGVGPVEAGLCVLQALSRTPVDLVINLGSAGSRRLPQAEIFQASSVAYRDMDASALGFEKGVTPFSDLPAEIALPQHLPGLPTASLATGASIVNGSGYENIHADMVDMESYAVARACHMTGAGYIGLRGISDGAHPIARFSDWTLYLAEIDAKLAEIILTLPDALAALPKAYWMAR